MSPVRKVSNRGGNIIGKFPSVKMGKMIAFESTIELDYLHFVDQDAEVTFIEEQPLSIEYEYKDKKRHYTPDFHVIQGGVNYLIECKPTERTEDPENVLKFEQGNKYCDERGWLFQVVTDTDLRSGYILNNLKILRRYAFYNVSPAIRGSIMNLIGSSPSLPTIQQIKDNLPIAPGEVVVALMWMAYRNEIFVPLENEPISDNTVLSFFAPAAGSLS
jgi:hypothetical protein